MPKEKKKAAKAPSELHKRMENIEKNHDKVAQLGDELRIISTEYADIRSRLEATDVLIDHVIHQLDAERNAKRMMTLIAVATMVLLVAVTLKVFMGF